MIIDYERNIVQGTVGTDKLNKANAQSSLLLQSSVQKGERIFGSLQYLQKWQQPYKWYSNNDVVKALFYSIVQVFIMATKIK